MDKEPSIQTDLDKYRYHTLYLEATQKFQIINKDHHSKHIDFAKGNLAHIAAVKNGVENGNEIEDKDGELYCHRPEPRLFKICFCFFIKYMTLGSNLIFKYTLQKIHTLQVYCMIVLVYGCENQLVMRYQILVIYFTQMCNPNYIFHMLSCKFPISLSNSVEYW